MLPQASEGSLPDHLIVLRLPVNTQMTSKICLWARKMELYNDPGPWSLKEVAMRSRICLKHIIW